MATLKQKKAIAILLGNNGISVGEAMRRGGYSRNYSKNPQTFLKSKMAKEELKPIIERLESQRDKALARMDDKLPEAKYGELNSAVSDLTKTSQLLGGGATERIEITREEKEAVDKAFEDNEL